MGRHALAAARPWGVAPTSPAIFGIARGGGRLDDGPPPDGAADEGYEYVEVEYDPDGPPDLDFYGTDDGYEYYEVEEDDTALFGDASDASRLVGGSDGDADSDTRKEPSDEVSNEDQADCGADITEQAGGRDDDNELDGIHSKPLSRSVGRGGRSAASVNESLNEEKVDEAAIGNHSAMVSSEDKEAKMRFTPTERRAGVASRANSKKSKRKRNKKPGRVGGRSGGKQGWNKQPPGPSQLRYPQSAFVTPLPSSRRAVSSHSNRYGWSALGDCAMAVASALGSVLRPVGSFLQSALRGVYVTVARWAAVLVASARHSIDTCLYGAVDGVTTTGLASRRGGLGALLSSMPPVLSLSAAALLVLVVARAIVPRMRGMDGEVQGERDEDGPSIEQEIEFLNKSFAPANPAASSRIAETIARQRARFARGVGKVRRERASKMSRRGQRQFTIKSIQSWWKERPGQQSIAIIEPRHLRDEGRPLNQEIKKLHRQLQNSEQERELLRAENERLRSRINGAQENASRVAKGREDDPKVGRKSPAKKVSKRRARAEEEAERQMREVEEMEAIEHERMLRGRYGSDMLMGRNDLDLNRSSAMFPEITREVDREYVTADNTTYDDDGDDVASRGWTAM
mmetsp:Transcript_14414/g.31591  ORF Transcript_14414/g.31591 Transcript_14414/m.31591 type:complete len:628 (+) Transcript_14414:197-2080(+)